MGDTEIKCFDSSNFTKENNYYIQLLYRILRKDGKPITEFNKDNALILNRVQVIYDLFNKESNVEFERAKIEVNIKIAAKDTHDEIFIIEKKISDDTGEFYADS
ncbi:hypothetical protein [Clostridium sp. C8]|jgi:hypothetical protein|uniref:hypothetical protein n=1 Tax=Clostridium sp. C8 TaxID=1667357 RepID=UPI00062E8A05|nr:hypothetical protein [Clostridium sp. C8]KLE15320.1 hypothetical protein AAT22_12465 [Clostridium sp. C8]MDU1566149.1 hypothetical protein [Clostridium sp.]